MAERVLISSVSKQFIATAALLLAEDGLLTLDEPIRRWIEDAPAEWGRVSLHHLLSNTAGFGHWKDLDGFEVMDPGTPDDLFEAMRRRPLLSAPGEQWRYSGPGFWLASRVIQTAASTPYARFLTERVLVPAGLSSTTCGVVPAASIRARGHSDGREVPLVEGLTLIHGTADIWSTEDDLVRFVGALTSGTILSDASLDAMTAVQHPLEPDPSDDIRLRGYGYGLFAGDLAGRPVVFHPGDNPGFRSWLGWARDQSDAVVAVLNDDDGESPDRDAARRLSQLLSDPSHHTRSARQSPPGVPGA